ncbi:MAG TPA: hypothetical protein VFI88_08685 [Sphingomicrobium sp.]|jgi:hypothetical protein|nr:hypothetical protein [Sphingomicrobium sp.]
MTYGLSPRLFVEDGPAVHAAEAAAARPSTRFLPWRKLDPDCRLKMIEHALSAPANDLVDELPLAL